MTGVRKVRFCYSNDDGEPYGLSTAAVYAQMAQPLEAQTIDIAHLPISGDEPSLYAHWKARQDG